MGNDLISRKEVLGIIEPRLNAAKEGTLERQRLYSIFTSVREMPAAYDVDKVIGQLAEKTDIAYKRYMDCGPGTPAVIYTRYSAQYQERRECLETVRAGMEEEA